MTKSLFLLLLIAPAVGFSFLRPGILKKIERCELFYNPSQIFPGNEFDVYIMTVLKDCTEIHSIEGKNIGFSDYVFELSGGAKIVKKNRKKLTIRVDEDAHENPVIGFSIQLRRKKAIRWSKTIPVKFDVLQEISFQGNDGYDPRTTTDDGYKSIPIGGKINIQFVDNSQTLTNNSDPNIIGGRGPDLNIYVSLIDGNGQKMVQVEIFNEDGTSFVRYVKPKVGELEISTNGGKGGISKYGGRGGKGGDVHVYITPEAKEYYKQVFISNFGGEGGELWRPKVDGQQQGPYGDDGKLIISNWDGTRLESE